MLTPGAISTLAVVTMCIGLVSAGVLAGWWLCEHQARREKPPAAAAVPTRGPLAAIEIQMFGRTIRTDATVDLVQLEALANGVGMTITRMPTTRVQ